MDVDARIKSGHDGVCALRAFLALESIIFTTVGTEEHGGDFCTTTTVSSVVNLFLFQVVPSCYLTPRTARKMRLLGVEKVLDAGNAPRKFDSRPSVGVKCQQ
jgi:hypothetical protein